jgi:hypothetical protein
MFGTQEKQIYSVRRSAFGSGVKTELCGQLGQETPPAPQRDVAGRGEPHG